MRWTRWLRTPPTRALALFERGGSRDSGGRPDEAEPLYREALALGLPDDERAQCTIQLASTLRNLGRPEESLALLRDAGAVPARTPWRPPRSTALTLASLGRAGGGPRRRLLRASRPRSPATSARCAPTPTTWSHRKPSSRFYGRPMSTEAAGESQGFERFRAAASRLLPPLAIVGPLALVLASGVIPPARPETGWATLPVTTLIFAAILVLALLALVRTFAVRGLRTGRPGLTSREAGVVALLVFLMAWWCMGLSLLAHGPGGNDGIGSLAYINGSFGTRGLHRRAVRLGDAASARLARQLLERVEVARRQPRLVLAGALRLAHRAAERVALRHRPVDDAGARLRLLDLRVELDGEQLVAHLGLQDEDRRTRAGRRCADTGSASMIFCDRRPR